MLSLGMVAAPIAFGQNRVEAATQASSAEPAQVVVKKIKVASLDEDELQNLAQREARAQGLDNFRGGEPVIIIGTTTLIIVGLIVIIIILLT